MVVGKGSLILDRPLTRDFLAGTNVRLLTDTDQYRVESTDIYLQNPQPSHSRNGERETPMTPHGGNGNLGTTPHIEQMGLDVNSHSGNGAVESDTSASLLPCGKPRPPIERVGTPAKELTLQTWLLRSHFQQNKVHWKQCHEYYVTHEPTAAELDQEHRFKPSDVERALNSLKFLASSGSVLQVIQGIRDFEGQFIRAMKGVSLSCVLCAKLLLHGVQVDLELLQSKKTSMEQDTLVFDKENVEEHYMPTLESKVHSWLADHIPKDIQTKASNRANTLSARMLIVEYYFTAIQRTDTIGFAMSKFIRTPTNTATTGGEVLSNIESWKASIQINYEVTKTMPSQQEITAAFQRLIESKVASDLFKFHQDLIVSQIFGTQNL